MTVHEIVIEVVKESPEGVESDRLFRTVEQMCHCGCGVFCRAVSGMLNLGLARDEGGTLFPTEKLLHPVNGVLE